MQLISERTGPVQAFSPTGIDFVAVAESHVLLFSRLKNYVHGELEEESADFVDHAHQCELGAWLHGEGARHFGHLSAFNHLREIHEKFHDEAHAVLSYLHGGSWIAAEQLCKREFSQSLRRVLITLTELNEVMKKQAVSVN